MKDILARANRDVLREYAWSNVLLAFDYDGTLAPIVSDPNRAPMRPATARLLDRLALLYPCVVISGRAQRDAARWLRGIPLNTIVGNHGVEPHHATPAHRAQVRRWIPGLESGLGSLPGVWIEDKSFSVAIHYRRSRQKRKARAAILRAAAALGPARVMGGKLVVNILPLEAPHKGLALEKERDRFRCDTAVYVGDDETDEDVFAMEQPGRLLPIRVGRRPGSAAPYFLKDQTAMDELLRVFIHVRRKDLL